MMRKYFVYLDELRESGETNMFGARIAAAAGLVTATPLRRSLARRDTH